jgi:hypothetical protein
MVRKIILNQDSRSSVRMPEFIYEAMRSFIIETLLCEKEITLNKLFLRAEENFMPSMQNNINNLNWYLLYVKHDLESRRLIRVRRAVGLEREQIISLIKSRNVKRMV